MGRRTLIAPLLGALLGSLGGFFPPLAAADEAPPALVLAHAYPAAGIDPAAYLVSEKLDGVRAFWDGQRLRFRSGGDIQAPAWWLAALPPVALDGELWLGRGRFETLSGIVRRAVPDDEAWRAVRYMVFELPEAPGDFATRAEALARLVAAQGVAWLDIVPQRRVGDRRALQQSLNEVLAAGGEGLMLHLASATYRTGRSDVLLKLKPQDDDEAMVIGHLPGQGRHAGRLGALRLRRDDGVEFSLGSGLSDRLRDDPPALGSRVSYRYRGLTAGGLPRFASFWRIRPD